ncbi:phage tail protein [Pseudomonas sp. SC11]|uniref:phage tail protein n=1 Tax=Pseudomonas sp. SC11 TaxID=326927 RepID=UPI00399A3FC3
MADQNSQFYAILTNVGAAKQANADALGIPWKITQMGVGDGNGAEPTPNATQTRLINEWRRAPLNQLKVDDKNPAIIVAEQVIPAEVGGKWIREIALYDADGDMIAIANCPPTFKPLLNQGSGRTQVVRMNLLVSSSSSVELKIDPSVVLATREYVDRRILEVLPQDKKPGTYTQVTINQRGIVVAGENPTTLAGYGITDALSTKGGTLTGNVQMTDTCRLYLSPGSVGYWAYGLFAGTPKDVKAGLGFWGGEDGVVRTAFLGLGTDPWYLGPGIRVKLDGTVEVTGTLTGSGAGLSAVPFAALTGVPNTLAGDGIAPASQVDAETGADTNKPMTALRVFQAIAAKVLPATVSRSGIAAIASQNAVDSGADDSSIVTPKTLAARLRAWWQGAQEGVAGVIQLATQAEVNEGFDNSKAVTARKLRAGVSWAFGKNGYVALPTWLGGWIMQWGIAMGVPQATNSASSIGPTRDVPLYVTFPNEEMWVISSMFFTTMNTTSAFAPGAGFVSRSMVRVQNNYVSSAGDIAWIAFGR